MNSLRPVVLTAVFVFAMATLLSACGGGRSTLPDVFASAKSTQLPSAERRMSSRYSGIQLANAFPQPFAMTATNVKNLQKRRTVRPSIVCPLTLTGCGGGGGPTPMPRPTPTPIVRYPVPMLDPFRSGFTTGAPQGSRSVQSVSSDYGGHGVAGFAYQQGASGNGDVWVAMDVISQSLNSPFTSSDGNTVFAPTMKGPNGNCLEATIVNANGDIAPYGSAGSTTSWFQLYDWCAYNGDPSNNGGYGTVSYSTPINSDFNNNYVRVFTNGDGRPEVVVELAQDPISQAWEAMLYNEVTQQYDVVYRSSGTYSQAETRGWLMFEYYYEVGNTCSPIQPVGASGNRYTNDGSTWTKFDQSNATIIQMGSAGNVSCFLPDSSNPADPWYVFQGDPNDYGFYMQRT
jgi:hypothetical protein